MGKSITEMLNQRLSKQQKIFSLEALVEKTHLEINKLEEQIQEIEESSLTLFDKLGIESIEFKD